MDVQTLEKVIEILKFEYKKFKEPIVTQIVEKDRDPYKVLIGCVLSLRTKDEVTSQAAGRLFNKVSNPYEMVKLSKEEISKLIYPVGFYNVKSKNVISISRILIEKYGGRTPDNLDELLKLPGVGRKTANLVLTVGYKKAGICVDTHVHRISNRLGFVKTKTPEKTEFELRKKLPLKHWIIYNDLLVTYGQNICKPISPLCSKCKVNHLCEKNSVTRAR